jgi:hypothetical protein
VATDGEGIILLGSREPIEVDRDVWLARLKAARRYLGAPRSEEIADRILGFGRLEDVGTGQDLNYDMFPRDEFISPR